MKETAEESAVLKQRLKHEPMNPELEAELLAFPCEWGESVEEVLQGYDTCSNGSFVAREILRMHGLA